MAQNITHVQRGQPVTAEKENRIIDAANAALGVYGVGGVSADASGGSLAIGRSPTMRALQLLGTRVRALNDDATDNTVYDVGEVVCVKSLEYEPDDKFRDTERSIIVRVRTYDSADLAAGDARPQFAVVAQAMKKGAIGEVVLHGPAYVRAKRSEDLSLYDAPPMGLELPDGERIPTLTAVPGFWQVMGYASQPFTQDGGDDVYLALVYVGAAPNVPLLYQATEDEDTGNQTIKAKLVKQDGTVVGPEVTLNTLQES